ncbi:CATK protein, partial [Atractosteus spatula]|nr:CATK protein [Atractosteus spatula]
MKAFSILASVSFCLHMVNCIDPALDSEWEAWQEEFGNPTREAHPLQRREIWEQNYRAIEDHNSRYAEGQEAYEMAMNQFGDLTAEEFVGRKDAPLATSTRHVDLMLSATELRQAASRLNLTSIDYRASGYVTPVEDQGICGSCWAYSATGALEAQWKKKTGHLIPLSKQQLIDCTAGIKGCTGGWASLAYDYIIHNEGIQAEATYPYVMREQPCAADKTKVAATIGSWKFLPIGSEQALEDALVTIGPVAISIDTTRPSFQFYRRGIYYDPECSVWKQTHAMLLTGFGTEGSEQYWTIRNSWGPWWGEDGYVRLAKNRNRHCGISQYGVLPFV